MTTAAFEPALAQQKKGDAKAGAKGDAKAGAKGAAAAPAGEQSAWVKLCEKAPVLEKGKDGKEVRAEKSICLTHHERLDGNTGMVLVSAAVRQVEGLDKQHLMVMVPLGMAIQPGLRATVYNKEMWEKVQKNEKVEDAKVSPVKLNFSLCHPAGCTAELELTKELMDQLKTGAGIMVFSINANGQVIAFPVPLTGFAKALEGPPVDNAKYSEARRQLMAQIQQRQQHMAEEYRKQQEQKRAQQATGSNPPAKAPPAKK
jgi:invasion protein IalB